jgi:hypothetical protein
VHQVATNLRKLAVGKRINWQTFRDTGEAPDGAFDLCDARAFINTDGSVDRDRSVISEIPAVVSLYLECHRLASSTLHGNWLIQLPVARS